MTEISFSNSLSLANDFGVKLLSGMLNMRIDYSTEVCPLVEVTRTTEDFTTERMADFRAARWGSLISVLEASDSEVDPTSNWGASEIRHIILYTRDPNNGAKRKRATFDVFRNYLDGEEAEGWTEWRVKNVFLFFSNSSAELIPDYAHPDDREPLWGTRVES